MVAFQALQIWTAIIFLSADEKLLPSAENADQYFRLAVWKLTKPCFPIEQIRYLLGDVKAADVVLYWFQRLTSKQLYLAICATIQR